MNSFLTPQEKAYRAAADWLARLNAPDADARDREAHAAWLNADALHAAEYRKVEAAWAGVDIAKDAALKHLRDLDAAQRAPWFNLDFSAAPLRRWAVATALLALAFLAGVGLQNGLLSGGEADSGSVYATRPGEHRSLLLSDGSTLLLNGGSKVRVEMSTQLRRMDLLQGEALFNVKKDTARPFVVLAKGINVRAVGTSFNVNLLGEKVDVTVIEGVVVVSGFPEDPVAPQMQQAEVNLSHGQKLSYRKVDRQPEISKAQVERVVAWQGRKLFFDSASLEDVVIELGRSYPSQFKIMVTEPVNVKLSGVFEVGDLEATLKAIELVLPVRFERQNDRVVHILPKIALR